MNTNEKKMRMIAIIIMVSITCISIVIMAVITTKMKKERDEKVSIEKTYQRACEYYQKVVDGDDKMIDQTRMLFTELKGYKDSVQKLADLDATEHNIKAYNKARSKYEEAYYDESAAMFRELNGFRDSADYEEKCHEAILKQAEDAFNNMNYEASQRSASSIPDYSTYYERAQEIIKDAEYYPTYTQAKAALENGDNVGAAGMFRSISAYRDSSEYEEKCYQDIFEKAQNVFIERLDDENTLKKIDNIPEYSSYYPNVVRLKKDIKYRQILENYQDALTDENEEVIDECWNDFVELVRNDYPDAGEDVNAIGKYYYDKAESCFDTGDFIKAVYYINKIDTQEKYPNGYDDTMNFKSKIVEGYKREIKEQAENILKAKGFDEMKAFLQTVDNSIYPDDEIDKLISDHTPVDFIIENYNSYDVFDYVRYNSTYKNRYPEKKDSIVDYEGNEHYNCLYSGGCKLKYHVGDYSLLTGTIFVREGGYRATENEPVYIKVTDLNGEELYTKTLLSGYGYETFTIDISNTEDIIIIFDGECDYASALFGSTDVFGALGDLKLIP